MSLPQLLELPNGEKAALTFSPAEMDRRLRGLRGILDERGLDAAVFTSMHGIKYYSDFLYCSFGRPYALVVDATKAVLVVANIDYGQPWRRSVGDTLTYTDWQRDNHYHGLARLLPARPRLGVEEDHLNLQAAAKLRAALPGAELEDIAADCMQQRMIKSAEEIALIRDGARVADLGGETIAAKIAAGVAEHELALLGTEAMVREIARLYPASEIRDSWVWLQSGINTDGAHNPLTTRRLESGDILSLNCFPMIAGYYTALERTLFLHTCSAREREIWQVNCEVHRRGLVLIRPGVRCCDIAAELNEIYLEHDLLQYRTFGYGHSFGVLSHYYGREAGLEIREDIETELRPNMVVSMEPMLTIPQGEAGAGGYREHDILVLTEQGAENITGFPFGPEHNIIGA